MKELWYNGVMNFKEFYKLLDGAISKDPTNIVASGDNFNTFIFNRYLSFYHPEIAKHIAKTSNRVNWLPDGDNEEKAWQGIRALLPKLPKLFISYVKKPAIVTSQELEISEDFIKEEAMFNECSKREIRDLILWKTKHKETNYSTM